MNFNAFRKRLGDKKGKNKPKNSDQEVEIVKKSSIGSALGGLHTNSESDSENFGATEISPEMVETDRILDEYSDFVAEVSFIADVAETKESVKVEAKSPTDIGSALRGALENARDARDLIEAAQAPILEELARVRSQEKFDPIEIEARLYQVDLVANQLNRAADIAEKRLAHFATLTTPEHIEREKERCREDIGYWYEYYAWTVDPRPDAPLNLVPLGLFEFQEKFVAWLFYIVFKRRSGGVVEKARDMGATETAIRFVTFCWLFMEGFSALLLSRTEDEVDSKKDPNTLFEKVRGQLRLLPPWMLPEGFSLERDMPYMLIANPVNGSTIVGRAPTETVGRQLRVACVIVDEMAFGPNGFYKQYTSLSQTTKSIIGLSSVGGRHNKFADLANDGKTLKFIMDWREHPWKTEAWYDALPFGYIGAAMSQEAIAQEVDRNYDASQPGKVFSNIREEYLFITWEEFTNFYASKGHAQKFVSPLGLPMIPLDWSWGRLSDYGQTVAHAWTYTLFARPTENYPLSDTIFIFIARPIEPTAATEHQGYASMCEWERFAGVRDLYNRLTRKPVMSENSHEQDSLRQTFLKEFGETWHPWNTDYHSGISQLRLWFTSTDNHLPNPFRPMILGRCRIVFVAPENEYRLAQNETNETWFVTASQTEAGFRRLRMELASYHYPVEERGKAVQKMRPAKIFDDIIDTLRAIGVRFGTKAKSETADEQFNNALPEELKPDKIREAWGTPAFVELANAKQLVKQQFEKKKEKGNLLTFQAQISQFFGNPFLPGSRGKRKF